MKIQKYNYDSMLMEDVEIDDRPIAEFINWILASHVWMHDPELLFNRVNYLKRKVTEAQVDRATAVEPTPVKKKK